MRRSRRLRYDPRTRCRRFLLTLPGWTFDNEFRQGISRGFSWSNFVVEVHSMISYPPLGDASQDPVVVRPDLPDGEDLPNAYAQTLARLSSSFQQRFDIAPHRTSLRAQLDAWAQMAVRAEYNFALSVWSPARAEFIREGRCRPYRAISVGGFPTRHLQAPAGYLVPDEWLQAPRADGTVIHLPPCHLPYSRRYPGRQPDGPGDDGPGDIDYCNRFAQRLVRYVEQTGFLRNGTQAWRRVRHPQSMECRLFISCITPCSWEDEFVDLCCMFAPGLVRLPWLET